jgi:hypothetical protein
MFEGCGALSEVKCISAHPAIIQAVISGERPPSELRNEHFTVEPRAFANCSSLERFKFAKLIISFLIDSDAEVAVVDDENKEVLFRREAFLGCEQLNRYESSFAGALIGSDRSAFNGCPQFDDFID